MRCKVLRLLRLLAQRVEGRNEDGGTNTIALVKVFKTVGNHIDAEDEVVRTVTDTVVRALIGFDKG